MKLDSRGKKIIGEQTWPDEYEIFMNNVEIYRDKSIKVNTSIKKRKDKIFVLKKSEFKDHYSKDHNSVVIYYKNKFDNKNSFIKDKGKIFYFLGIFGTSQIKFEDFLKSQFVVNFSEK